MSLENWAILLDKIKHHPIKNAKLMGMGEPLLHPQFDEITKQFKNIFPDCFVIVATNCQYFLKGRMKQKFENSLRNIDQLYLSIDGYEASYERDRSPAKWHILIDFLEDLQSIDKHGCDIVINYVVNTTNIQDIEKTDELRKHYNLGKLRLNIAQSWGENDGLESNAETFGYTREQLDCLKSNWRSNIMGKSEWEFSDCFWVKNGLYITVEGDVKVCCMNTETVPVGNIFEDSIENIQNSERFQRIKNGCATNDPNSHCVYCSYKELIPILQELI